MIRPIGEIFEFNGVKLQVVKCSDCEGCYFYENQIDCCDESVMDITSDCSFQARTNSVIFKEVADEI